MFLYVENFLPLLKTNQTVLVLYFYLCWFVKTPPPVPGNFSPPRLPPITTPPSPRHTHKPSISTSETEKAIDNHATTFCCRLRPIRANHSTVGVVARRLFCVWFVAAWVRGGVARPPPSCAVALLSGVGFKGKETHHWLYTPHQSPDQKPISSHFINTQKVTQKQCVE